MQTMATAHGHASEFNFKQFKLVALADPCSVQVDIHKYSLPAQKVGA